LSCRGAFGSAAVPAPAPAGGRAGLAGRALGAPLAGLPLPGSTTVPCDGRCGRFAASATPASVYSRVGAPPGVLVPSWKVGRGWALSTVSGTLVPTWVSRQHQAHGIVGHLDQVAAILELGEYFGRHGLADQALQARWKAAWRPSPMARPHRRCPPA
jgi:hypothetical protein